jgi:hypothetical protein
LPARVNNHHHSNLLTAETAPFRLEKQVIVVGTPLALGDSWKFITGHSGSASQPSAKRR